MTLHNATRSLTPALRRLAYRQARTVSPRQFSASAHSAPKSSDTTWMVRLSHPCSFFILSSTRARRSGPRSSLSRRSVLQHCLRITLTTHIQTTLQIGYLLSPSARSKPHHAHSATGHGQPSAPVENTPTAPPAPPAEPIKVCHFCPLSTRLGCLNDCWIQNEETIADAEGTEVSAEQVKASITQTVVRFHSSSLLNSAITENLISPRRRTRLGRRRKPRQKWPNPQKIRTVPKVRPARPTVNK